MRPVALSCEEDRPYEEGIATRRSRRGNGLFHVSEEHRPNEEGIATLRHLWVILQNRRW
jgi:hypothetical protein